MRSDSLSTAWSMPSIAWIWNRNSAGPATSYDSVQSTSMTGSDVAGDGGAPVSKLWSGDAAVGASRAAVVMVQAAVWG